MAEVDWTIEASCDETSAAMHAVVDNADIAAHDEELDAAHDEEVDVEAY